MDRRLQKPVVVALLLVVLLLQLTMAASAALRPNLQPPKHGPIAATRGLIQRRLGDEYVDQIALRVIDAAPDGLDVFEIGTAGEKVEIAGNSATAMAYGLQQYFKQVLHTQTDWDNYKLLLPKKLPKVDPIIRKQRTSKYSYYQNVCTRELQQSHNISLVVCVTHFVGINMPLAFTGQEKVWQSTFRHFNVSDKGLGKFFAGAGFLAWGRMGNVRGSWVKGPLPQKFIDDQFELQLKTLDRMKEFGMIPALPGFAGHIPEEIKVLYPDAKITRSPNWNNFPEEFCCVYMVDPVDPLYLAIGKKFIEEQTRLYNYTSSLYQADTFNEMDPDTTDPVALANSSLAVIKSMVAADPDAVWLMQGWLFQSEYWTNPLIKAYLGAVPDDKMIILDLYSEAAPIWNRAENYFGKSWIYCVLHNFGGSTGLRGDLPTVGSDPVHSLAKSAGTMIGVGLTMEGIYQNYVVYDLALQMAWEQSVVDIPEWIKTYAYQRYNSQNEHAQRAWQTLSASVYNQTRLNGGVTKSIVMLIPHWKLARDGFMPTIITYDPLDIVKAWNQLLLASDELRNVDTFRHDVTDLTRQYLSDHLMKLYLEMKDGYENKTFSPAKLSMWKDKFLQTIVDMDEILATNNNFLLGNWIADARALGAGDAAVQDYYEYEARNLVTRWGDNNNNTVHDYAGKEWAGLVKGYYLARWRIWLTEVCQSYAEGRATNDDVVFKARESFELKWQLNHDPYPTQTRGDTIAISKRLYYEYIDSDAGVWDSTMLSNVDESDLM
ncbi:Alpha-n-acetylglucosaminidase, partial [Globisporangium splendens]